MTVKTGQVWAGMFLTQDATGALATPTTGPVGALYVDGTANAAEVTITGSNPYKFAVTLPALTAGQRVDMYITATIATIATAGVVASEQADTVILSDGVVVNSGTVTTVTNGVSLGASQGAITWGRQKIIADVYNGGALEITNTNTATNSNNTGITIIGQRYGIRVIGTRREAIYAFTGLADGTWYNSIGGNNGVSIANSEGNVFGTFPTIEAEIARIDISEVLRLLNLIKPKVYDTNDDVKGLIPPNSMILP